MAEEEGGEISRRSFHVAYIGEGADEHSMDVEALGPALLAFGKLVRASNREINGDRASIKVLVASDFEHKCFNINFEVIQTVWTQIKDLIDAEGRQRLGSPKTHWCHRDGSSYDHRHSVRIFEMEKGAQGRGC